MAATQRSAGRPGRFSGPTEAEDAAGALALVVALVCGLTLLTLALFEVLGALPDEFGLVAFLSVAVFTGVLGWALISRLLSTPSGYRSHFPTPRNLER